MYITIIGPMGSGKTTLAVQLYQKLLQNIGTDWGLLKNTDHEVFSWERFKGKHGDDTMQAPIQNAILENHFHNIFGCFLQNKDNKIIADSDFMEHRFYNNMKLKMGRYDEVKWQILDLKHRRLDHFLPFPDITIRLNTSADQVVENIMKRNRFFEHQDEQEKKDRLSALLEKAIILKEEYDKYAMVDIEVNFGEDINVVFAKLLNEAQKNGKTA